MSSVHHDNCLRPASSYCFCHRAYSIVVVLNSFTLKSLMCRNSSMIDLDFLSISSSDNEGLSEADVVGISGFTTSEV